MIDFRYHLVSLVSVFIALAVGIVLGAGPLKDPISEGLSQRRPPPATGTPSSPRWRRSSSPTGSAAAASSS
jgi:hypothetical protein